MQESVVTAPVYRNAGKAGDRPVFQSMLRGAKLKCPACGVGALYRRFLKVSDTCPNCGEELHHHRADDAPPYFTIVIVGHIVVGLVLFVEMTYRPPLWVHAALWLPITLLGFYYMARESIRWSDFAKAASMKESEAASS